MQSEEMAAEVERLPEADNKSFTTRLCELPVALAAVNQLSEIYSAVKERNCVTRMAFNAGEKTIDMANTASKPIIQAASTCSLSKPIVGTVECAGKSVKTGFSFVEIYRVWANKIRRFTRMSYFNNAVVQFVN